MPSGTHKEVADSPDEAEKVNEEQARKRQRNRFAQQKYRRNLKSHIQDLEKRAAAADCLLKANIAPAALVSDGMSHPRPTLNQSVGHQIAIAMSECAMRPRDSMTNVVSMDSSAKNISFQQETSRSPDIHNNETRPLDDTIAITTQPSKDLFDETDASQLFTIADHSLWSKPFSFTGTGNFDMQSDGVEMQDSFGFRSGHKGPESFELPSPVSPPLIEKSRLLSDPTLQRQSNVGSRVEYVLQSMKDAGFDDFESFLSCYLNDTFEGSSPVKVAQSLSRSKGLSQLLENLRTKASSWSMWDYNNYKGTVIRSAAEMIADEFERLTKKKFTCEVELQQSLVQQSNSSDGGSSVSRSNSNAAELKRTLQDELPSLYALTTTLSTREAISTPSTMAELVVTTIQIINAPRDEPLQEAIRWVMNRVPPGYTGHPIGTPIEEFAGNFN